MQKVHDTTCAMCGVEIKATKDDDFPECDACHSHWMVVQLHGAIMDGEMDHIIDGLYEREEEEEE